MANGNLKYGVTLYSFSNSFHSYELDLEGCVKRAKELGFKGIGIVAAQSCPEYPYISDEWLADFKAMLEKYDMEPVQWEGYIDFGMRYDRDLTEEEVKEFVINDLTYAKKAGFPICKTQHSISPKIFREMLPVCKRLGVKLAIEMHYPHNPDVPVWKEYFKIAAESEGYLGCCLDMSIFQRYPHQLNINEALRDGCRTEVIDKVLDMIKNGTGSKEEALKMANSDIETRYIAEFFDSYNHPYDPQVIKELIDYIPVLHGKYYYEADGEFDPCIPYEKIMPIVKETGYDGYILAEYEGHHHSIEESETEQLDRYIHLLKKYYK